MRTRRNAGCARRATRCTTSVSRDRRVAEPATGQARLSVQREVRVHETVAERLARSDVLGALLEERADVAGVEARIQRTELRGDGADMRGRHRGTGREEVRDA